MSKLPAVSHAAGGARTTMGCSKTRFQAHHALTVARIAGAFCALAALSSLVAGCGNNPYPAGEAGSATIHRVLADDPKTLDPSIAYDVPSANVIDVIYPTYFQYHYLHRDPFVLDLALGAEEPKREKWPVTTIVKGKPTKSIGERWTFKIKPGLHFQDDPCFAGGKGREIVASDFLHSFRRMSSPAVACPIYPFFGDKILGLEEWRKANAGRMAAAKLASPQGPKPRADYSLPIEGLQTDPADPYTFRIVLNQPYPQLRYLMAMHFTSPLAHEAIDKYGNENLTPGVDDSAKLSMHPVGCGAFKVTEYIKKSRIILTANPNYREETYPTEGEAGDREAGMLVDAGRRLPLASAVQFSIMRESITSFNQFLQGYEDLASVSQQNYQQVMAQPGQLSPEMTRRGYGLHRDKGVDVSYFCFNMNDPTFGGTSEKNRKLRQAISLSIDSQEMIDLLDQGLGVPAQYMVAPGLFSYDPEYKNPYRQFDPNLGKAKKLLAEAGYPGGIDPKTGKRLTLVWDNYNTTPNLKQQTGLVMRQISRLGLNLDSRESQYPVFEDKVEKGHFQFMNFGWVADYPDPENFVFLLYGPNGGAKFSGPNYTNYDNPEYNKLFEQMRAMNDGPARAAIIAKMRAMVEEDCPWICTLHSETFGMTQPWIKNYKPHPVALDGMKYWRVDAAQRAQLVAKWNVPNYWPLIAVAALIVIAVVPAAGVVNARTNRRVRRNPEGSR